MTARVADYAADAIALRDESLASGVMDELKQRAAQVGAE